jgi:hypothetical protein
MKQVLIVMCVLLVVCVAAESPQPRIRAAPVVTIPSIVARRLIRRRRSLSDAYRARLPVVQQQHFVYDQTMNVERNADAAVCRIAAAIGERARASMLYCLIDGRARTSTELAVVADVPPSTAVRKLSLVLSGHTELGFSLQSHELSNPSG